MLDLTIIFSYKFSTTFKIDFKLELKKMPINKELKKVLELRIGKAAFKLGLDWSLGLITFCLVLITFF